jgi:hypothetical protein
VLSNAFVTVNVARSWRRSITSQTGRREKRRPRRSRDPDLLSVCIVGKSTLEAPTLLAARLDLPFLTVHPSSRCPGRPPTAPLLLIRATFETVRVAQNGGEVMVSPIADLSTSWLL